MKIKIINYWRIKIIFYHIKLDYFKLFKIIKN